MLIYVTPFMENRRNRRRTPNLRIALAVAVAAFATISCDWLGPGNGGNPIGPDPTPPPSAGATILYAALAASEALGVGSSVPCLPFTECADGRGYVQVAARPLARIYRHRVQPRCADVGHRA